NFQSRVIEEKMLEQNIAYQVVGVKFYERKEVKDALAYLRAAINKEDFLSLRRAVNMPPRGIGKVLAAKFLAGSALKALETKKIQEFQGVLGSIAKSVETKKPSAVMKDVLEQTGLLAYHTNGTEEGEIRKANLEELLSLAKRYDARPVPEGIQNLLEDAALMSDQDTLKTEDSVRLMTVHAAKGLEFKIVFIAGLEEGLFPHQTMSGEEVELRQEEERRLFYVALTRAKQKVFLSYAVFRTIFGSRQINRPSTFLFDIPAELLERAPEKTIMLE
ncbi:MAG: 3'-5' exonuclease, partial [Patescibacteria group bacterium]